MKETRKWMHRIDALDLLKRCDVEVKTKTNEWATFKCPFHDDKHPSSSMALQSLGDKPPGIFNCKACGEFGTAVGFWAKRHGMSENDAMEEVRMIYAPAKKARDLPTDDMIQQWRAQLHTCSEAWDYLVNKRGLSESTLYVAEIGYVNDRIVFPVRSADGEILNVRIHSFRESERERGIPKMVGYSGQPARLAYPANLIKRDAPIIWVEGEIDALTLHSIGVNAATSIGGVQSMEIAGFVSWIPSGAGSEAYICFDNDKAGRKQTVKFKDKLIEHGVDVVWLLKLPTEYKDINDLLCSTIPSERKIIFDNLIRQGTRQSQENTLGGGLYTANGSIVNGDMEIVAPFTGHVVSQGRARFGQKDMEDPRAYVFALEHHNGEKVKFKYIEGLRRFRDAIMDAGGFRWAAAREHSDAIFVGLCNISNGIAESVDTGFLFGYEGMDLSRFWTKTAVFTENGVRENDEIRMEAPARSLGMLDLPMPSPKRSLEGAQLLLRHLYDCHYPTVMGPMIASALLAPIRKVAFPEETRFSVLLHGPTGSGKTSRARAVACLFGDFWPEAHIETWASTPKYIQQLQAFAGDSWLLVDELPVGKPGHQRTVTEAMGVLQGVAQGHGRGRLQVSGAFTDMAPPPSCILATTMEALPDGDESLIARTLPLEVPLLPGKQLMEPKYKRPHDEVIEKRRALPYLISGWVEWMMSGAGSSGVLEEAKKEAETLVPELLDKVIPAWHGLSNSTRIRNRMVVLTATWFTFLSWTRALFTDPDMDIALDRRVEWVNTVLPSLARNFFGHTEALGMGPTLMVMLCGALGSGDCRLMHRDVEGKLNPKTCAPEWAANTKPVIGYFCASKNIKDSVTYQGEACQICLISSATPIWKKMGREVSWNTARAYLESAGMVSMKIGRRFSDKRVLWLSKQGATALLRNLTVVPPS